MVHGYTIPPSLLRVKVTPERATLDLWGASWCQIESDYKWSQDWKVCHAIRGTSILQALRLWSMLKRKHISQPDLTEVRFGGATNVWKKMWKKQGWKCRKVAEHASESTTFMIWKRWTYFFVSFVCDVEGMTCLVYTHDESLWKRHAALAWWTSFVCFKICFWLKNWRLPILKQEHPKIPSPAMGQGSLLHFLHLWQM